MMEILRSLKNVIFAHPRYFDFWPLVMIMAVGLLLVIWAKRRFRPTLAHDSRWSTWGRDLSWLFLTFLTGLMVVALAGPQLAGFKVTTSGGNLDIIFVVDKSVSMAIKDISPSRHEAVVREILNFVQSAAVQPQDRVTLFTFSEKSNWLLPLSEDKEALAGKLMEIEHPRNHRYYDRSQLYTYMETVLRHIPEALAKQDRFFQNSRLSQETGWAIYPRLVFLFSDGDSYGDPVLDALARLAKNKIKVYTVAVGTAAGGQLLVTMPTEADPTKFESLLISSKLNTRLLDLIKNKTGGEGYVFNSAAVPLQSWLAAAVNNNRQSTFRLVPAADAKNFWWDLLALPSLLLVFLIIIKI